MPQYAVVRGGVFIETRTYFEPIPSDKIKHENGVPQLRPYTEVKPSLDPAAETLDGPVYNITDSLVTATWTKRNLTPQELSDRKDAAISSINGHFLPHRRLSLAFHNRIRALEGQAAHTMPQFLAYWKALL